MKRVARELGENLSEEELQAMIDEFDRDQDGEISSDEFMCVISSYILNERIRNNFSKRFTIFPSNRYIMKQSTMY